MDTKTVTRTLLPAEDLNAEMKFFESVGFKLDNIFPTDSPCVAVMSGHNAIIRLDKDGPVSAGELHILTDEPKELGLERKAYQSPAGTVVKVVPKTYVLDSPETVHTFEVRKLVDSDSWVIGRAGMLYRDLIPDRLGGSIMASHIRIPGGGPVPDMVHYHTIGFQLIFCYRGWVKLVYEDQGDPFILQAGECVTQPPEIRHKVLEASDNLEVIEIGVPAEHMTTIDHEMELPNDNYNLQREYHGQTFCHHKKEDFKWTDWNIEGFENRDTGISESTKGLASVNVIRPKKGTENSGEQRHDQNIYFSFVLEGKLSLDVNGHDEVELQSGEAFVVPPQTRYEMKNVSEDLELLEVKLNH